jgi:hypothetical protein
MDGKLTNVGQNGDAKRGQMLDRTTMNVGQNNNRG